MPIDIIEKLAKAKPDPPYSRCSTCDGAANVIVKNEKGEEEAITCPECNGAGIE